MENIKRPNFLILTWEVMWGPTKNVGPIGSAVSLWAEFVNKNRCISVRLVSEEVKTIKFWLFW